MLCPKCGEDKPLTEHHVFPRRHFTRRSYRKVKIRLCRQCHNALEKLIPRALQPEAFYQDIVKRFLAGDEE